MKKIRMIDEGADLHHLVIFGKDVWMNDKDVWMNDKDIVELKKVLGKYGMKNRVFANKIKDKELWRRIRSILQRY